jgi:hypothetical protein
VWGSHSTLRIFLYSPSILPAPVLHLNCRFRCRYVGVKGGGGGQIAKLSLKSFSKTLAYIPHPTLHIPPFPLPFTPTSLLCVLCLCVASHKDGKIIFRVAFLKTVSLFLFVKKFSFLSVGKKVKKRSVWYDFRRIKTACSSSFD